MTWTLALLAAIAAEPESPEKSASKLMTPATDQAIERGLKYLAGQQHADGSFGNGPYYGNTGVTALAGMAFLSAGNTPGRGPYGRNVERAVEYLVSITQQSGFINAPRGAGHGPMYGHGFATLFLAECYGMSQRPGLRDTLVRAVKLIENSQNKEGGWRYYAQRADADISVTICQVMALRAARNAGIYVPKETIDHAVDYVKRCQNTDGGFRYRLEERDSAFPRSAAAVVALHSAGIYEGPELRKAIDYLLQFQPKPGVVHRETYYDYGHYYAVQAMWQTGGEVWARWYPAVRDELIARQAPDGSWSWMSSVSLEASTGMCVMVLGMPNDSVPIFQR